MRDVLNNIRRTPFQSMSVFLLQFFGAFLLLVSLTAAGFLMSIFNRVEVQIPVIVYFKPNTAESDILRIRENLMKSSKIGSIDYVDKQRAFEFYKAQNKDNPLLLEMTSAENFPASLNIQAKRPEFLAETAEYLRTEKGVDEIQFEKETVERLVTITKVLRVSIVVLASYLALMTFITLVTMVMFKIALRKDEIELHQLLGATSGLISKPFFDEGIFLSFLSSMAACGLFGGILFAIRDSFNGYLTGIAALTVSIQGFTIQVWPIHLLTMAALCGIVLLYVVLISILATRVATRKYIQ
jgi:cell division transport system permease protein